jgi:hypothetical protein
MVYQFINDNNHFYNKDIIYRDNHSLILDFP